MQIVDDQIADRRVWILPVEEGFRRHVIEREVLGEALVPRVLAGVHRER
jgi:hypothetical protein